MSEIKHSNLMMDIPNSLPSEIVGILVQSKHVRVERIVSTGHCSPADFWYDQNENEWVLVVQGKATLMFDDGPAVEMMPGDHLLIPAHCRHRVQWTTPDEPTVWIAVFYDGSVAPAE
jgi:cupin 2 domain-containing protein